MHHHHIADEGPAKVQTLTPEEMAASGAATDWNAVAEQVDALQKRLDEMGPVNLVAIEEYEETEQRYQFLTKQHDDLVKAKAQLLEVINRINTQTQEMFTRDVRTRSATISALMFTEVFGGGKADLILVDEDDVLESGIDIVARPPGKQLQTHFTALRRRADHDRRGAAVLDLPGQAEPVLRAGRIGCAAGRIEHQPFHPRAATVPAIIRSSSSSRTTSAPSAWPTCFTA